MFVEHLSCVRDWRYDEQQTRSLPLWSLYSSGGDKHSASKEINTPMDFRKGQMPQAKVELGEETLKGGASGRSCIRMRSQGSLLEVTLQ